MISIFEIVSQLLSFCLWAEQLYISVWCFWVNMHFVYKSCKVNQMRTRLALAVSSSITSLNIIGLNRISNILVIFKYNMCIFSYKVTPFHRHINLLFTSTSFSLFLNFLCILVKKETTWDIMPNIFKLCMLCINYQNSNFFILILHHW